MHGKKKSQEHGLELACLSCRRDAGSTEGIAKPSRTYISEKRGRIDQFVEQAG